MFRNYNLNGDLDGLLKTVFGDVVKNVKEHAEYLVSDIKETATQYVLSADVPGVNKEDISIDFVDGDLKVVVPERKLDTLQEGEKFLLAQRNVAKKVGNFKFNKDVDEDSIKASYKDGVLIIEIAKKEKVVTNKKIIVD